MGTNPNARTVAPYDGRLSVTESDYYVIADAIAEHDTDYARGRYRAGDFDRADRVTDLNKRYRWDLYYCAQRVSKTRGMDWVVGYYNSSQIDSALRRIVPDVDPFWIGWGE